MKGSNPYWINQWIEIKSKNIINRVIERKLDMRWKAIGFDPSWAALYFTPRNILLFSADIFWGEIFNCSIWRERRVNNWSFPVGIYIINVCCFLTRGRKKRKKKLSKAAVYSYIIISRPPLCFVLVTLNRADLGMGLVWHTKTEIKNVYAED